MDESGECWYFLPMTRIRTYRSPGRGVRAGAGAGVPGARVRRVAFDRRKYGRHLLIDVGWVHELRGFILDGPHSLGFFDIMLVTRGEGSFWLDAHRHTVRPGMVFFTTPGQVRQWEVAQLDGVCLFFEDFFVTEFLRDDAFLHRLPYFHAEPARAALELAPPAARRVRSRLAAMQRELANHGDDSVDVLRAQLHETLIVLAREYAAAHRVAAQRPMHRLVTRFLELVARDAARRHRIADYASELAVTPGYLSALCSRYAGQRAKRLLDAELASRARRMLLYSDESAARVAASLGFDDASYFSRFFRRETGQTPREFRNALRR